MNGVDFEKRPEDVAEAWEGWCGETAWSQSAREFVRLGGEIDWICGYPRSKSAIPLCFTCVLPSGERLPGKNRLADIKTAIKAIQSGRQKAAHLDA